MKIAENLPQKPSNPLNFPVMAAMDELAHQDEANARGAVFTRLEVVDFILDLLGYTKDKPLHTRRLYDRADVYIPFIERSLLALSLAGQLGCADRWMKNRYAGLLRSLVARQFHLKIYVDMVDTAAFHSEINAYPAITIINREAPDPTRIVH